MVSKTTTKPIILNVKIENNLNSNNDECCDLEAQQKKKTSGLRLPKDKNQLSYGHGTQIYSDPFGGLNYNEIRRINDQGQTMYQTLSRDMQNYYQDVQRQQNNFNQMLNNLVNQPMPQIAAPIQQAPQLQAPPFPAPQVIPQPQIIPPTAPPAPPLPATPAPTAGPALTTMTTPQKPPNTPTPATPQQTPQQTPQPTPTPSAPIVPTPPPPPRNPHVPPAVILANLPQAFSDVYKSLLLQNDRKTFNGFLESFNGKSFIQKKTADRLGLYPLIELALSKGLITNDKNRLLYSRYLNEYQIDQSSAAAGPVQNPLIP